MNLMELTKLDIKDLQKVDYKQLLTDIQKQPDILFSLVLVIGALIFSLFYSQSCQKEQRTLRYQITALQKKTGLISTYNDKKEELSDFFTNLPKQVPENEIITTLTDLATKRGVKIESLTPSGGQDNKLFKTVNFRIDVSAEQYQNMWLFTRDIERSGYNLRIENWVGNLDANRKSTNKRAGEISRETDNLIKANIEIAAFKFIKE